MARSVELATRSRVAADVPTRIFAAVVDAVLISLLIFCFAVPVGLALGPAIRLDPTADTTTDLLEVDPVVATVDALVAVVVSAGYFVGSWTRRGRSIGQQWFGLWVSDLRGRRLGLAVATRRWAVVWGPVAALGLIGITGAPPALELAAGVAVSFWWAVLLFTTARAEDRRGVHDRINRSVVTKQAVVLELADQAAPSRAG